MLKILLYCIVKNIAYISRYKKFQSGIFFGFYSGIYILSSYKILILIEIITFFKNKNLEKYLCSICV